MWILFLNTDGTVKAYQKISDTAGSYSGPVGVFGISTAFLGDLDGDGVGDLAVGAFSNEGGPEHGVVSVLFLQTNGRVKSYQRISNDDGNFTGTLDDFDRLGYSAGSLGDHDGDGNVDLVVGATGDDDGGSNHGAVWILFLDGPFRASATPRNGAGLNTPCHTSLTLPALGSNWDAEVAHGHHPGASLTVIYGYLAGATGPTIGAGELLVDVSAGRAFKHALASSGMADVHSFAVPADPALAGLSLATQALILGGGAELCNAVDLVIGL